MDPGSENGSGLFGSWVGFYKTLENFDINIQNNTIKHKMGRVFGSWVGFNRTLETLYISIQNNAKKNTNWGPRFENVSGV